MKKTFLTTCLLATSVAFPSFAQPTMATNEFNPTVCGGGQWDNCMGVRSYGNGNVYVGEFKNGVRSGFGKLRIMAKGKSGPHWVASEAPSTYIGEFKDDMLNGHGVWITDTGLRYEGEFVNNLLLTPQRPRLVAPPASPAAPLSNEHDSALPGPTTAAAPAPESTPEASTSPRP